MSMNEENESSVDYQVGANGVNMDNVQLGNESEEDFVEFELEANAVFKRLAMDIYQSDDAGIREPLTNAVTATLSAIEQGYITRDEATIHIKLFKSESGNRLVIRDNGIGISEDTLQEVLSVIGRSTVRDRGDQAGQFGMGFLAVFRLIGADGGFIMHTNSRKTDAEPISGIWNSNGFTRDSEGELPGEMGDDEYGTKFEFVLNDDIETSSVRSWVDEYAEWARTSVIYQEFNDKGQQVFNEDYGRKTFLDEYDTPSLSTTLDTPYFTATTAEEATGRTILLDVPIERNYSGFSSSRWDNTDIRLKNENGVIVDGPNEGLMPVADAEYEGMPEERKAQYVPRSSLSEDDVEMPGPTGTRDSLAENAEFWDWLFNELDAKYKQTVRDIYEDVDTLDELLSLPEEESRLAVHAATDWFNKKRLQGIADIINDDRDSPFTHAVDKLPKTVKVAERGTDPRPQASKSYESAGKVLWNARAGDRDGDVFMGVSLNPTKAKVAWADSEDNQVIEVQDSDYYDKLNPLGFRKLRGIKSSTIDEFDVPESLRAEFKSSRSTTGRSTNVEDRTLTIHYGGGHSDKTDKRKAKHLQRGFERVENGETDTVSVSNFGNLKFLVLFPSHKDKKVSKHYKLTSSDVGVAKCSKKVWEYLSEDTERVLTLDEYIQKANSVEFETNRGVKTMGEINDEETTVLFHSMSSDSISLFKRQQIMDGVVDYLTSSQHRFKDYDTDDVLYAPVRYGSDLFAKIHPVITDHYVLYEDHRMENNADSVSFSELKAYMWARLPEWRDTTEFAALNENLVSFPLSDGGLEVVETLALLHDADVDPCSERMDLQSHLDEFASQ